MTDPIQVESAFRDLMVHLETTISIRHRIKLIKRFLNLLDGEFKKYETYIVQLINEIPAYTIPLTWSGLDPEDLEEDIDLFETVSSALKISKKQDRFGEIITKLREVCLLLYCCLNDKENADRQLNRLCNLKFQEDVERSGYESLLLLLEKRLHVVLQRANSEEKRDTVHRLIELIKFIRKKEYGKVLVPVVEAYDGEAPEKIEYGRLRQISVEIYGSAVGEDQIIQNYRVYGAEKPVYYEKGRALTAARRLFEFQRSNSNSQTFKGGISFELSGAIHNGDSANAAVAALWYTCLLEANEQRERFKVNPLAAITGDIEEKGNILPVDQQSIGLKVKAAFFSWAELLVVPSSQRRLFEKKIMELRKKYPGRNLHLIVVSRLNEMFYDRRLADHNVQSRIKYLFSKLKSRKYRIVSIPLIVVLMAIIGWQIYGPIDKNPVAAEYEGEHMVLKNQYGRVIQTLEVGSMIVEAFQSSQNDVIPSKANFHDVDGDGINEVFFSRTLFNQNQSGPEELIAYSVTGDSLIWKKNLSFDIEFPNKPDVEENGYVVYSINILDNEMDDSNISVIANLGHVKFFPSLIIKLNARNGEETGQYVHTGRIKQTETVDIDGDGEDEIIGLGQNNAFNEITVLFALDSGQINGHSPLTDEYKVTDYQPAKHNHYVQIPQTIVGRVFKRRIISNNPEYFHINYDQQLIRARVNDFILPENDPFQVNYATLIFMFDFDFYLRSIGTQSYYDLWAKNLYEDGLIPFEPDHEYFEAFKDSLLYWDGEGFVYTDS